MTDLDSQPQKRTILGEDGELREEIDLPVPNKGPIFCTQCGSSNPADANFCWKCGKTLSVPDAATASPQTAPKRKVKNEELFEADDEDEYEPEEANHAARSEMDWRSMRNAARQARLEYKQSRHEARSAAREEMLHAPLEGLSAGGLSSALSLLTMVFVGIMTLSSLVLHGGSNSWISILVFVAWFMVEGARRALRRVMTGPVFLVEFFTMLFVTGMVTSSLIFNGGGNTWVSVIVMVMWFLVEGARGALGRVFSAASVVTDIGTMVMVTGLVISSMIFGGGGNAWLSVPVLVGWLLVEGARKALGHGE